MANTGTFQLPRQRLPFNKKTKEWRKSNIDYADKYSLYNDQELRKSLKNKLINLQLYNGIVDVRDIKDIINPYHMDATYIPDNIPHNPIIVPKLDLLLGEEVSRRFDINVVVVDPNSITNKDQGRKQFIIDRMSEMLSAQYTDEELEQKLNELDKYMKYNYKDLREKMANQILNYYWEKHAFASIFNECFKDALLYGEECVMLDIVHDEPVMVKLNPLKVRAIRSSNSDRFEDASLIIIEDYKSPAQLVDEYHDELKPEDIDYIMNYSTVSSKDSYSDDHDNHVLIGDNAISADMFNTFTDMFEFNGHYFGSDHTDAYGNIRELKVRWKSLRKVKKIKYYDEFGNEQHRFESEEYKPVKELGEEEKVMWINEAWEGTKLGKNIYMKMRPMQTQFVSATNPSKCHLGIIGQIYSTGQGKAVSLMDRAKNYQYLYDVVWDRLNKAIASNHGKILELDLAKVPANWEIDKWMHFAFVNKIAVNDSFKEGVKGAATGKLAGSANTIGGRSIDMDNGNYIQQHIQLLEFIKMEMGEILGVSKQREGQISNRETVGAVERSVNQSSHITEYWFHKHEQFKIRALTAFLETAKVALRRAGNKVVQNILDDMTTEILYFDVEEFSEADYGIVISNSRRYAELEQLLKENAQAMLQNGGSFTTLMDIMFSPSMQEMRRKIEQSEEDAQQRTREAQEAQSKQFEQQMQLQAESEQAARDLKKYEIDTVDATKRYIAELNRGQNVDGENDNDLERDKYNLDVANAKAEHLLKIQELAQDMEKHKDSVALEKERNRIARITKSKK